MKEYCELVNLSVDEDILNKLKKKGVAKFDNTIDKNPLNTYYLLEQSDGESMLARQTGKHTLVKLNIRPSTKLCGIQPRDARQASFVDSLISEDIPLSIALGPAGTGKTTLAIAYAIDSWMEENKPILLCKSTKLVGASRAFGPVPGDIQEKYAPHIASYEIVLKKLLGGKSDNYISLLKQKKAIEYIPVEYVRGCTFEKCTFILDEVQNLSWHELKTVISRMGEDTKLIILGDPLQADINFKNEKSGIEILLSSQAFKRSPITSAVYLETQYRSEVAQLIADIDKELSNETKQRGAS